MTNFVTLPDLLKKLALVRPQQSIVLVTGCFDILHSEHIKLLQAAKNKGGMLLVGVESDRRVRQLKGIGRPVNRFAKRIRKLVETGIPDYVFPLPEKFDSSVEHEALMAKIRPQILAVSSHTDHLDQKKALVSRYGGELRVVLPHNPQISTSRLLKA